MLAGLLSAEVFVLLLVFARVGAMIMMLPGFSETYVAPRFRLVLAIAMSVAVTPILRPHIPELPASPIALFLLLGAETGVGLLIGLATRFLISSLHVAGMVVSMQSALASATMFDPGQAAQGSLIGSMLTVTAMVLIFSTGLHHLMLRAIVDSYAMFPPGEWVPVGDFAALAIDLIASMFVLGLQIAAPIIVAALILFLGLGLLARLMPAVQVFFVAMPLQILLSFVFLALTISAGMLWFLDSFEAGIGYFLMSP